MRHSYILDAFTRTPWAIVPERLAILQEIVARHVAGEKMDPEEVQMVIHGAKRPANRKAGNGNIAVLPLFGTIFPRANMMTQVSGATSAEIFGAQFDELVMDPEIGAIVLDVDSPGGQAGGIDELSRKIFDARGKKPIVAVANHSMDSAAYWIGTAADEVVVTPSGDVGSIGVFAAHWDESAALEKEGFRLTLISEGKYKTEGNPYQPLTEEAHAAIQGLVREVYDSFVRGVARNRGKPVDEVRNGFGEGRVVGARQAVKLGMADRIGTLEETIGQLQRRLFRLTPEEKQQAEALRNKVEAIFQKQREGAERQAEVESVIELVNALRSFENLPPLERTKNMIDLKPYYDAVNAAEAEVQRIANDLDALFRQESDEARAQALAMQPELEKAQAKHDEAVKLYESMQLANRPNDVAKNFVPVSTTQTEPAEGSQPTVIKRQEYDRLSLVDRAKFVRSGATVED